MHWEIIKAKEDTYFIWTGEDLTAIGFNREEIITLFKDTYGYDSLVIALDQLEAIDTHPKEANIRFKSLVRFYELHGNDLRKLRWLRLMLAEQKDNLPELLAYYSRLSVEDRVLLIKVAKSMIK